VSAQAERPPEDVFVEQLLFAMRDRRWAVWLYGERALPLIEFIQALLAPQKM
jgi:hypothetical protein